MVFHSNKNDTLHIQQIKTQHAHQAYKTQIDTEIEKKMKSMGYNVSRTCSNCAKATARKNIMTLFNQNGL